jgi:glycosyltransferase involved in cell wall biosynthesis
VDELFKLKLKELFPDKTIKILPNGYDPEEMSKAAKIDQNKDVLTFSFIGTIYRWHPVSSLLKGFFDFSTQFPGKTFKIKFYGINEQELIHDLVQKHYPTLKEKIEFIPKIPNGELLQSMAKDNVLILFNYYQFTGTKIYDYLGLKRKILLCFTDDPEAKKLKEQFYFKKVETNIFPQKDILDKTMAGTLVENPQHLSEVIKELHDEFSLTGMVLCDSVGVENYSRKIQVEKLAEIVKELASIHFSPTICPQRRM